jgi:hypothetical protein
VGLSVACLRPRPRYEPVESEMLTEQHTAADTRKPSLPRRAGCWARLSASVPPIQPST